MIIFPSFFSLFSLFFSLILSHTRHLPMPFISLMKPCYMCVNVTTNPPLHHLNHTITSFFRFLITTLNTHPHPFPNPPPWPPPDLRTKCRGVSIGPSHSAAIRIASQSDDFPGTPGFFLHRDLWQAITLSFTLTRGSFFFFFLPPDVL